MDYAPSFQIYTVHRVTGLDEGTHNPDIFLECYADYITTLKRGEVPQEERFRPLFSGVWSVSKEALYSLELAEKRRLIKVAKPVVQSKLNQICYSPDDQQFRTQIFGTDSICWGIQLSFPTLYLDPKTFEAKPTREFPNMALFKSIQRWIREKTRPTPFRTGPNSISYVPIRLGKKCFSWIASHPQLQKKGLEVASN